MAISIAQLVQDLSEEDVLEALLDLAKAAGLPVTAWKSGEPIYALLVILSEWFAKYWNNYIVKAIRAGFLEYSEGDWLTLLAWVTYGVVRNQATFASGSITLENRAGGLYTFLPGEIRIQNANQKTFTNVTGGSLAAWTGSGDYPTVDLDFQADEAGSDSNTSNGEIEAYPNTPVQAPAGVYALTNEAPMFGDDEEDDDSLKERCRLSTGPLSPAGPKSAYEFIALSAKRADGVAVGVNRVKVEEPGGCVVNVYLASPSGATTGDLVTADTDLYIVNQAIQTSVVPAGITCNVAAATEHPVTVTLTLTVNRAANISASEASNLAKQAVEKYFRELPIGGHRLVDGGQGYVSIAEVLAKASEAHAGIIIPSWTGFLVTDKIALASNEVAVPTITIASTLVTQ